MNGLFDDVFKIPPGEAPKKGKPYVPPVQAVDVPAKEKARITVNRHGLVSGGTTDLTLFAIPTGRRLFITSANICSAQVGGTGTTRGTILVNQIHNMIMVISVPDSSESNTISYVPPKILVPAWIPAPVGSTTPNC